MIITMFLGVIYIFFITNYVVFFLVSSSVRLLGKVEVPLGELLSNNEIERSYDLVDGKNNPTLVSTIKNDPCSISTGDRDPAKFSILSVSVTQ